MCETTSTRSNGLKFKQSKSKIQTDVLLTLCKICKLVDNKVERCELTSRVSSLV